MSSGSQSCRASGCATLSVTTSSIVAVPRTATTTDLHVLRISFWEDVAGEPAATARLMTACRPLTCTCSITHSEKVWQVNLLRLQGS